MARREADAFIDQILSHATPEQRDKTAHYFKTDAGGYAEHTVFAGVRMGDVFSLAKEHLDLSVEALDIVLQHPVHEVRAGALSVMDKQARRKRTPTDHRAAIFDLYLRRHDRIDNWDLVDLAAPHVVGGWLFDKPRDVLFELARSAVVWERRTAIMATLFFVRNDDLDDTFALAELLLGDNHDMVHKPTGGVLREAGRRDKPRLLAFLDAHAAQMPRTMLRVAMEHLDADTRAHYRSLA